MNDNELCWNITSKCNQNCIYCFRAQALPECSLVENTAILDYLIQQGIKKLTWSGGEPLLYEHLSTLLEKAYVNGIVNKINTNASLLTDKRLKQIGQFLATFTLSLDSVADEVNYRLGRGKSHYLRVVSAIDRIKQYDPQKKVVVNVVVNRYNLHTMPQLIDFLNNSPIDGVRLFQVSPIRGRAISTFQDTSITLEQFEKVKQMYIENIIHYNLTFRDKKTLESKYLVITPDGNLCYNLNGKDIILKRLRGICR